MGDYGVLYPLWGPWGLLHEDPLELQRLLGVDERLLAALEAWQERWESRSERADYEWLEAEGNRLLQRLKGAAPDIKFEFIPPRLR